MSFFLFFRHQKITIIYYWRDINMNLLRNELKKLFRNPKCRQSKQVVKKIKDDLSEYGIQPKTRFLVDNEYKIPTAYSDIFLSRIDSKSWKDRTKKRHQYE